MVFLINDLAYNTQLIFFYDADKFKGRKQEMSKSYTQDCN